MATNLFTPVFQLAPILTICLSTVVSSVALAQSAAGTGANPVLATVNGRPIEQLSVDHIAKQISAEGQQANPEQILEELINLELLTQAAEKLELDVDPEISATLKLQYTQTMANAYLARKSAEITLTDEELRREYELQSTSADRAEYKASHILLESEEQATAVLAELSAGKLFSEAATEHSIDPAGDTGGDLGWFTGASMVPEFTEAVASMEVGDISAAPVKSEFGYHIINLVDKREAALPTFNSVKTRLTNLAVRRALAEHVEELRSTVTIDRSPE